MNPIRVVLADDHPIMRDGIRLILAKSPPIELVGETGRGDEVLCLVERTDPDVLLLDMELPGLSGVEIARSLHASKARVRVLALSAFDDRTYIQQVLEQGAAGYLMKEEAPEYLIEAIQGVARGEEGWISRKIAVHLSDWTKETEKISERLSAREREILKLLAAGNTNHQIGSAVGISEKTVEKYMESIFKKFNVSSRVAAAVRAVREKMD